MHLLEFSLTISVKILNLLVDHIHLQQFLLLFICIDFQFSEKFFQLLTDWVSPLLSISHVGPPLVHVSLLLFEFFIEFVDLLKQLIHFKMVAGIIRLLNDFLWHLWHNGVNSHEQLVSVTSPGSSQILGISGFIDLLVLEWLILMVHLLTLFLQLSPLAFNRGLLLLALSIDGSLWPFLIVIISFAVVSWASCCSRSAILLSSSRSDIFSIPDILSPSPTLCPASPWRCFDLVNITIFEISLSASVDSCRWLLNFIYLIILSSSRTLFIVFWLFRPVNHFFALSTLTLLAATTVCFPLLGVSSSGTTRIIFRVSDWTLHSVILDDVAQTKIFLFQLVNHFKVPKCKYAVSL